MTQYPSVYKFTTFEELDKLVVENEGVLSVRMEQLRDALGVKRLGPNVNSEIRRKLLGLGLNAFPEELPLYQEMEVRIYKLGSPVADLITAVTQPSAQNDERLRTLSGGNAEEILNQIRAIVSAY